jgi:beta-galactosidase
MIGVAVHRFLTGLILAVVTAPLFAAASPRLRYTINDQWRYAPGPAERAHEPGFADEPWERVNVPHTWNAVDAFDKRSRYRRGIGWYRRSLTLDPALEGKRIFLYFEGANQVADVYVNGHHAGQHIGGYTAFAFDVTKLVTFDRPSTIAVRVDNAHDPDIPPLNADFTFYGGIYRDVWLIATSPIHIPVTDHASPGIFISTPVVSRERAIVRIAGSIANETARRVRLRILHHVLDPAGNLVTSVESPLTIPANSTREFVHLSRPIAGPLLWSPDRPHVYRLRTEVRAGDALVDVVDNPFGFREFSADPDRGLVLNGRPLRLSGTNRHQDYPGFGNAMPDSLHRRDVRLIKENGFNFLRLAHYPQDPAVLEETDRLGLVVWEEIPVVNLISTSAAFAENSERMLVEMIRQHFNHPSIFFWGYMNEVLLTKPDPVPDRYYEIVQQLTRRLDDRARAEDLTRLTVMALSRDEIDDDHGIAGIPHLLGLNLYFGWYYETFASLGPFLDRIHRDRPAQPLLVS